MEINIRNNLYERYVEECKKIENKASKGSVIYLGNCAEEMVNDVMINYYLPQMNSIDIGTLSIEDCFDLYHTKHIACECDCDNERIYFVEEIK